LRGKLNVADLSRSNVSLLEWLDNLVDFCLLSVSVDYGLHFGQNAPGYTGQPSMISTAPVFIERVEKPMVIHEKNT